MHAPPLFVQDQEEMNRVQGTLSKNLPKHRHPLPEGQNRFRVTLSAFFGEKKECEWRNTHPGKNQC